jgi:hypothetical protein
MSKRLLPTERSITLYRTTRRNTTKDLNVKQNLCENLKSSKKLVGCVAKI